VPLLADMKPGGVCGQGFACHRRLRVVLKELLDAGYLHGDTLNVSGGTLRRTSTARTLRTVTLSKPAQWRGANRRARGAERESVREGALLKVAGLKTLAFSGTSKVFEDEESCARAVRLGEVKAGMVVIIRNEGPRGGPVCVRCWV